MRIRLRIRMSGVIFDRPLANIQAILVALMPFGAMITALLTAKLVNSFLNE
jgi:hypothetical protein